MKLSKTSTPPAWARTTRHIRALWILGAYGEHLTTALRDNWLCDPSVLRDLATLEYTATKTVEVPRAVGAGHHRPTRLVAHTITEAGLRALRDAHDSHHAQRKALGARALPDWVSVGPQWLHACYTLSQLGDSATTLQMTTARAIRSVALLNARERGYVVATQRTASDTSGHMQYRLTPSGVSLLRTAQATWTAEGHSLTDDDTEPSETQSPYAMATPRGPGLGWGTGVYTPPAWVPARGEACMRAFGLRSLGVGNVGNEGLGTAQP